MEATRKVRNGERAWWKGKLGGGGGIVGAVAVGLLMLAAPAAGATAQLTLIAPYKHTTFAAATSTYTDCGTVGGKTAKWAPFTGKITGSSSASSHGCSGYLVSSPASSANHGISVGIPFKVSLYSLYNVTASWTYQVKAGGASPLPGCPSAFNWTSGYDSVSCYVTSGWYLSVSLAIWDTSNFTQVSPVTSIWFAQNYSDIYSSSYCSYGTCSSSSASLNCSSPPTSYQYTFEDYGSICLPSGTSSGSGSLWTNTSDYWAQYNYGRNYSLVPYDTYALVATVSFSASAYVYYWESGYSGSSYYSFPLSYSGTAKAMINGVSPGNGLTLTSVVATAV